MRSRSDKGLVLIGASYSLIFVFLWLHVTAAASETLETHGQKDETKKIKITADKLIAAVDVGEIEFIGNVRAIRAKTVITADRLKIIYSPAAVKSQTPIPTPESIEKIIAQGRVKIILDDIIAEADMAEYTTQSAVIVLSGERSKVMQGGHSIRGTKFTLYRSEGKMTVDGKGENRVEAVFDASQMDQ